MQGILPRADEVARLLAADLQEQDVRDVRWADSHVTFGPVRWHHRDWHPLAAVGSGQLSVVVGDSTVKLAAHLDMQLYSPSSVLAAALLALPLLIIAGADHALAAGAVAAGGTAAIRYVMSVTRLRPFLRGLLQRDLAELGGRQIGGSNPPNQIS